MIAKTKTVVTVAAAALTLGAGVGVATQAFADPTASPSPTSTPSSSGSPDTPQGPGGRHGGPGRGLHDADLAKELASKLGVTEAKVTAALQAIRDEKSGTKPTPGTTRPDPSARDADLAKSLATKLGLDEAKVKTALDEIRAAQDADRGQALKDKLAAAVKAGTLTQAEADAVQKAVDKGVIHAGR